MVTETETLTLHHDIFNYLDYVFSDYIYIYIYYTHRGWNDKIVAQEKTTWFHFRLMKIGFLFFLQTIY